MTSSPGGGAAVRSDLVAPRPHGSHRSPAPSPKSASAMPAMLAAAPPFNRYLHGVPAARPSHASGASSSQTTQVAPASGSPSLGITAELLPSHLQPKNQSGPAAPPAPTPTPHYDPPPTTAGPSVSSPMDATQPGHDGVKDEQLERHLGSYAHQLGGFYDAHPPCHAYYYGQVQHSYGFVAPPHIPYQFYSQGPGQGLINMQTPPYPVDQYRVYQPYHPYSQATLDPIPPLHTLQPTPFITYRPAPATYAMSAGPAFVALSGLATTAASQLAGAPTVPPSQVWYYGVAAGNSTHASAGPHMGLDHDYAVGAASNSNDPPPLLQLKSSRS